MPDLRWYAIQTTAGHENKVRNLIARRIAEDTRADAEKPIRQALVPTQDVVEIKRQEGERRAEDLPGLRARGNGLESGDHSHDQRHRSEEHTSELQSRGLISYAV